MTPSELDSAPAYTGSEELYPIRTVATLTGVNPITLRAWERRYGLVRPKRTDSGHRLYTREDIDLIRRVLMLLEKGVPISQVRHALDGRDAGAVSGAATATGPWVRYRELMITAIARYDESGLDEIYNEVLSLYPINLVTRELLLPLLKQLGERWASAEGSVAEEHFFGVYLRNKLGARFHHRARGNPGPKLLAACLPGEYHEVGLLLFALAAHEQGMRVVLLGANTPLGDLPLAVRRSGSQAVVLSGSYEPQPGLLERELPELVRATSVPVFVGGIVSVGHRDAILAAGAVAVGEDIGPGVQRIVAALGARPESQA